MSTVPLRHTRTTSNDGGLPARRAVIRWAWRLFRREWRQQALVLALLTLAVAAAIFNASVAYNIAPVPGNAEFGTVNHYIQFGVSDSQALADDIAFAEERFGTIEIIRHWYIPIPGSTESIEFRTQDPQGPYSAPMLALLEGRYPTSTDEVALTDGVAETFALTIGDTLALDSTRRTVVGLVENPSNLSAEFVLVAPASNDMPEEVTILVNSTDEQVIPFRAPSRATTTRSRRPGNEDVVAAAGVFGTTTVTMLLIALIASASFVVVAQRRLRQLGMLAALGATEKHLRLVTLTNGAVMGVLAALLGTVIGLLSWLAAAPFIEPAVGFRIDPRNVPWWLLVTSMVLAIVTATGAAWSPARTIARIPITLALTGRPPKPKSAQRSLFMAGFLIAVGVTCLILANQTNAWLISLGTMATALGVLLLCPLAIWAAAKLAGAFSIGVRLALRDLARYQDRAVAALAAISLALGLAAATVITAAAAEYTADKGNLADNQLLIRTGTVVATEGENIGGPFVPERTPAELESLEAGVAQLSTLFTDSIVIPLDVALDPTMEPDPAFDGRSAVTLAEYTDLGGITGYRDLTLLYVATPELLAQYQINEATVNPAIEVLTVETAEIRFVGVTRERGTQPEIVTNVEQISPTYSSLPGSFITPDALHQRGWATARVGWLIEAKAPLTNEQLAAARDVTAEAGLTTESRDHQEGLLALRTQATATGMLVALGVLAMTVGLIRNAAAGDLRTLTATGATSRIRRTLTAATAGALALLGTVLGTAGAYLALIAGYTQNIGVLRHVPILHLLLIIVGVPFIAAITGWLLAGREPGTLVRQPIE